MLARGLKWADKLAGLDRAVARARLHYAVAHIYLQITDNKARSPELITKIKAEFDELLKLSPDEMVAYPFPHHLARALAFNTGSPDDFKRFDPVDVDRFERVADNAPVKVADANYDLSLRNWPNSSATETGKLKASDVVQNLMHFETPAKKGKEEKAEWIFVVKRSASGLGWVKRQPKAS